MQLFKIRAHGETPFQSTRSWLRRPLKKVASLLFARAGNGSKPVGESLRFLPLTELQADLGWAKTVPKVAGALAQFDAVSDEMSEIALSADLRARVQEQIQAWNGEYLGLNRSWIKKSLMGQLRRQN